MDLDIFNNSVLVSNIRRILTERGLTPARVEAELSWSPGLISRWAKSSPSFDKIVELVRYLGISLEDILSEELTGQNQKDPFIDEKLILKLYSSGKIWLPCDEEISKLIEPLTDDGLLENQIYYTKYKNGCFILAATSDELPFSLRLYIAPDYETIPQLISESKEKLEKLFFNADCKLYSHLVKQKTLDYIRDYLRDDD